jgi:hypothetical protein
MSPVPTASATDKATATHSSWNLAPLWMQALFIVILTGVGVLFLCACIFVSVRTYRSGQTPCDSEFQAWLADFLSGLDHQRALADFEGLTEDADAIRAVAQRIAAKRPPDWDTRFPSAVGPRLPRKTKCVPTVDEMALRRRGRIFLPMELGALVQKSGESQMFVDNQGIELQELVAHAPEERHDAQHEDALPKGTAQNSQVGVQTSPELIPTAQLALEDSISDLVRRVSLEDPFM